VRSIHAEAIMASPDRVEDGVEWRVSDVEASTGGLVRVRRGRASPTVPNDTALDGFASPPGGSGASYGQRAPAAFDDAHLTLAFVMGGSATLSTLDAANEMQLEHLEHTDCATLPPDRPVRWLDASADFEVIEISFLKSEEEAMANGLLRLEE